MAHVLENPLVWTLFRKIMNNTLRIDRSKAALIDSFDPFIREGKYSILDLGCGTGNFSVLFSGQYTGIDFESRYIEYAKNAWGGGSNKTFICADAVEYSKQMQKSGHTYDVVILLDFLHHLPDSLCVDMLQSAHHLARKFVLIIDPRESPDNPWFVKLINRYDRGKHIRTHKTLSEMIDGANLKILKNPDAQNSYLCEPIS